MKPLLSFALILICWNSFSQRIEFQLEGIVVDSTSNPIADAYIINLRNLKKSVSKQNGVFEMRVLPNDSLVIMHISYNRKLIHVFSLMKNPVVVLKGENITIDQVDVSPNQRTEYERAMDNISSIKDIKFFNDPKIDIEPEPVMQMMTEYNRHLRSEATSVRILRFSPSEKIQKLLNKLKKKKKQ